MAGGKDKEKGKGVEVTVTWDDIERVKNLTEQCMMRYVTKEQALDILYQQHYIQRTLTELVWERLEEENEEFFKEYYLRLKVKEQMARYNKLLKKLCELVNGPMSDQDSNSP